MILRVTGLTRRYGDIVAVDGLGLELSEGKILAVAGPDGAGKTSLFRALSGLIRYDSGEATIAGFDVATDFERIKPLLGYMPQSFSLYPDLSVEENLYFYAGLFGMAGREFSDKKEKLYEFSGLRPFAGRRAGNLSGGMKQKLALSCALIHNPRVLILDEPTTGVDPLSRRQLWEILRSLRSAGSAILVSTPYMDEVGLADHVCLLHEGHKLTEGTPEDLRRRFRGTVYELRHDPTPAFMSSLAGLPGLAARRFGSSVRVWADESLAPERARAELRRATDTAVEEVEPDLEDVFVQMMGN